MAALIQTIGLVAAFAAVVLLRLRLRTQTVETVFYLLFLAVLLFSECALFISPLAERLGGPWLAQVPYLYDIADTVVMVRAIDVVIARMMRGAISRTHLPPVMMPLIQAGLYCSLQAPLRRNMSSCGRMGEWWRISKQASTSFL